MAKPNGVVYYSKKIRRHNRQIFKAKTLKGGQRKRNQCSYVVFGFHRFDIVEFEGKIFYINSLRTRGTFVIQSLVDLDFKKEVSYKKLKLVQVRDGFITQPKFEEEVA